MSKFNNKKRELRAEAAAFPKYERVSNKDPEGLQKCKEPFLKKAARDLENCRGIISHSKRRQCIAKVARHVCERHNKCALDLNYSASVLYCSDYVNRSVEVYKDELAPKINSMNKKHAKSFSDPTEFNTSIRVGNQTFNVKTFSSEVEKKRGLMYKTSMKDDQGGFFIFDEEKQHPIWMYNTPMPLTIVWIDSNMRVVDIQNGVPCMTKPCSDITSDKPAKYILEVKNGVFKGMIGDIVSIKNKLSRVLSRLTGSIETEEPSPPGKGKGSCCYWHENDSDPLVPGSWACAENKDWFECAARVEYRKNFYCWKEGENCTLACWEFDKVPGEISDPCAEIHRR
ncbi:MAG: DUF192 domain-containing protein [Candidatus Poribacteria bacterium]|jgi:uncharacterized membrane protein (UPF0127 family)|nr:DUF192 domain-containing protein [Candidatus Poribacteria bacterium]